MLFAVVLVPREYGVCERQYGLRLIIKAGSVVERRRYEFEDAVDARSHALRHFFRCHEYDPSPELLVAQPCPESQQSRKSWSRQLVMP